ncbi:hypothetical protein IKF15_01170 [Candidatus Saccharibacteria bacterium]|nr:hypothetical protein [Candidatus Saccharibacteria bacterium]
MAIINATAKMAAKTAKNIENAERNLDGSIKMATAKMAAKTAKNIETARSDLADRIDKIDSGSKTPSFAAIIAALAVGIGFFLLIFGIAHANDWFAKTVRESGTGLVELEKTTHEGLLVAKTAGSLGMQWVVAILCGLTAWALVVFIILLAQNSRHRQDDSHNSRR